MDSSSDEDFFLMDSLFTKLIKPKRRCGVHDINKERASLGEYHHLFKQLKSYPDRFFAYMRMNLETFTYILNKIEHRLMKTWCNWHRPILPEERLVVTLRFLATGSSFQALAFSFRMGASTVGTIVTETVVVLWEELHNQHMPQPTVDTFKAIAREFFETWNFPHCVGAIDGKHVRVKCPANSGSMFYNYKNYFSVVLQAAVDAKYKFIAIDVGGYGKQSDGGTFQASGLYQSLMNKSLKLPEPAPLPLSDVMAPYVFIADEAYPLLTFLMKPFGGRNIPVSEDCFNKRLSRSRKVVECAFGILNSKWCILSKCIDTRVDLADSIIKCVCVLHNTIIDREGMVQNLTEVSFTRSDVTWELAGRPTNNAKGVRDIFTSYFNKNPLVYN